MMEIKNGMEQTYANFTAEQQTSEDGQALLRFMETWGGMMEYAVNMGAENITQLAELTVRPAAVSAGITDDEYVEAGAAQLVKCWVYGEGLTEWALFHPPEILTGQCRQSLWDLPVETLDALPELAAAYPCIQENDPDILEHYSACIGDESNRRSFVIWQDTDPQNYEFFIQSFDNLRGNRSVCYSVEPTQNIAAEVLNRMKLSEVEHKLQKSPMDSELLISKAGLLYDMDHHNYSQAVQVLLSAMYFSPDCFEAYDKLVEIAVAEEDSQRVSRWSSGVAVLARPEGSKHTCAKENRQQNPLSKRGTNSLDRCALKHLK